MCNFWEETTARAAPTDSLSASNKDLLKTPTVDNTSSVALEPDDKCNSEENSSVPVVQQR